MKLGLPPPQLIHIKKHVDAMRRHSAWPEPENQNAHLPQNGILVAQAVWDPPSALYPIAPSNRTTFFIRRTPTTL